MMNLYRDALDNGDRVVKEWREMDIAQMDWLQYLNYDWTSLTKVNSHKNVSKL